MRVLDDRVSLKARAKVQEYLPKCMNCGTDLVDPRGSIDARRFCSTSCKEKYVAQM